MIYEINMCKIKSSELRIGNYVMLIPLSFKKITGIDIAELQFRKDIECFGIKLTDDVLLKCGFIHNITDTAYWDSSGDFLISIEHDGFYFSIWSIIDEGKTTQIIKLDYLHKLQNVFFLKTGRELEVNI